jgi:serine/threonine-protein kinase
MVGFVQPGSVLLGKYRVERVIGVGGMGAVVAAQHLQLDERVAIKFLLPTMLEAGEIVQRFLREARAAIKIRSEHCVRVLDVGTLEGGAPYMVMEYLDGQDLSRLLEQSGGLPVEDSVDWVLQAAEALAEAHAMGIVHRDLKPANLFLTRRPDGTASVKVLDFGISKQTDSGTDASVTKTQAVLGSPRYMSPEQMRSTRDVDARADVWALGAVVHELIAGQPPFDAETMTALCAAILQDPPNPLRARRPDAPVQLETAILGALEKDRGRRYQNVAQFAAALAPFGTAAASTSAERIARVLGVPASRPGSVARPPAPDEPACAPAVTGPSPMAATTGGSATDRVRRATGPVVAAGLVAAVVAVAAVAGVVALKRHAGAAGEVVPVPAAAAVVVSPPAASDSQGESAAVLSARRPIDAKGEVPAPPSAVLSPEPAPVSVPVGSASAARRDSPTEPARTFRPVLPPQKPRPAVGAPPAGNPAAPPKPPPASSNPFGDDRKG